MVLLFSTSQWINLQQTFIPRRRPRVRLHPPIYRVYLVMRTLTRWKVPGYHQEDAISDEKHHENPVMYMELHIQSSMDES
jgi:hypothetical protein